VGGGRDGVDSGVSDIGMAEEKKPEYRSAGEGGWLEEELITSARKGVSRLSLGRLGNGSVERLFRPEFGELSACWRSWFGVSVTTRLERVEFAR